MIHTYAWNPETPNLTDLNGRSTLQPTTQSPAHPPAKWAWCNRWEIGTAIAHTLITAGLASGIAFSLTLPSKANPLAPSLPSSPTNPTAAPPNPPTPTPIPLSTITRMSPYDSYILGIGDLLRLDVTTVPEYNGEYQLGPDGTVTFPIIGSFPAQGLTIKQFTEIITKRYNRILKRPELTLGLVGPRPLRIAVAGEVNRPGSYSVPFVGSVVGIPGAGGSTPVRSLNLVTVSSLLQTAGGITQLANVRRVQVRRLNPPISPELLEQEPQLRTSVTDATTYTVDLWAVLVDGDLQQDFILRDGDMVIVPKAEPMNLAELTKLGKANIAPAKIPIHVIGEVGSPGKVELPPNSPMNLALLAAGGFNIRANRGSVDFIRLNPDGTVSRRKIKVDLNKGINEQTNPPLQENDVIFVDRSGLTRYADNFEAVLSPMDNFFNFVNILRFFGIIRSDFRQ